MNYSTKEEVLAAVAFTARFLQDVFPLDCMVSVTDEKKFIAYYSGKKIDIKVTIGSVVPPEDIINQVLQTGVKMVAEVPKEAYGYAFKGIVTPIVHDGKVIGTFNAGIDLSSQNELLQIAEQISGSFQHVAASSQELSASAQELTDFQRELLALSRNAENDLQNTAKILSVIDNVSKQTNLLGLNAAIEAARAGEHGKGFSVVAEEIRKLSIDSSASTKEISAILTKINENITNIIDYTERTEKISENQAEATQAIASAIQQNTVIAEKLMALSKIL